MAVLNGMLQRMNGTGDMIKAARARGFRDELSLRSHRFPPESRRFSGEIKPQAGDGRGEALERMGLFGRVSGAGRQGAPGFDALGLRP